VKEKITLQSFQINRSSLVKENSCKIIFIKGLVESPKFSTFAKKEDSRSNSKGSGKNLMMSEKIFNSNMNNMGNNPNVTNSINHMRNKMNSDNVH
jgi:hypothetical protein